MIPIDVWAPYIIDSDSYVSGGSKRAAIKTFFTLPSTGPGSCVAIVTNTMKGPLDTVSSVANKAKTYSAPVANALASGSAYSAVNLNNMLRTGQLDPFLGPAVAAGATTVAAGLNYVAAGIAQVTPYAGHVILAAADLFGFIGVAKEGYATATGKCHP